MANDVISGILEYSPNTLCFVIGANELALANIQKAAKNVPRPLRKQRVRREYMKWKRLLHEIYTDAENNEKYESIIGRLNALPLNAIQLTFDAESAGRAIDRMAITLQESGIGSIGISGETVSEKISFVWLWRD